MNRRRFLSSFTLAALSSGTAFSAPPTPRQRGFAGYLSRPEPAYRWEKQSEKQFPGGTVFNLRMVSQIWHSETWEHRLQLFVPEKPKFPDFCGLLNTGGSGSESEEMMGRLAANRISSPFAILYGIPKQPLYGGLKEDALIAYTWQKYLETGDDTWPLQFPMAKAVVKAMDALQAFRPELKRFMVTGASKRGWTTWLAGASGDKRIVGIVPMVIDILNLPAQIPHQFAMYGKPSEQVGDYTAVGFDRILLQTQGKELLRLVDAYSYRENLTLPKLIVLGTNDRYWTQDALNLYWNGLKGSKSVLYLPNSGHEMKDSARLFSTLTAFARGLAAKKSWPKPTWKYVLSGRRADLSVGSDVPIKSARLFHCTSPTTDFRDSRWSADDMLVESRTAKASYEAPSTGYAAIFGEMTYELEAGKTFTLSTQMQILGHKP